MALIWSFLDWVISWFVGPDTVRADELRSFIAPIEHQGRTWKVKFYR